MGDPDDGATRAAGASILFLLVVIVCIGAGCARFFLFLARCEKRTLPGTASGRRTPPRDTQKTP